MLLSSEGKLFGKGTLTFQAGNGISILDHLDLLATGPKIIPVYPEYKTGNELTIHSDMDSFGYETSLKNSGFLMDKPAVDAKLAARGTGAGKFTVAGGKIIRNLDSTIMVTAYDIDLLPNSALSAGTAAISIHASRIGQSIGLGRDH